MLSFRSLALSVNRNRIITIAVFLMWFQYSNAGDCDASAIARLIQAGDSAGAFEALCLCEKSEDAPPSALLLLASLYQDDQLFGGEDLEERRKKTWALVERAALTGDIDSIATLEVMFATRDTILNFGPEMDVADCLSELFDTHDLDSDGERVDSLRVRRCLDLDNRSDSN